MLWIAGGLGASIILGLLGLFWWIGRRSLASVPDARQRFEADLLRLRPQFFDAAAASGKPRGLRWKGCEWNEALALAREKDTGRLTAFVGILVQFEAIPGSDMEGLPAVGNLRNATAVFFFHAGQWHTTGKAIFNLNPDEAIAHFGYEPIPSP